MKIRNYIFLTAILLLIPNLKSWAHCEVPCGIYEDEMRIEMMREHITTISKAMDHIEKLSGEMEPQSMNQLVRWINTKEDHANKIQEIITQYFMTQRVEPLGEGGEISKESTMQLQYLHEMLVLAMKMKQSLDRDNIKMFQESMANFEKAYFGEDAHRHKPDGSHR